MPEALATSYDEVPYSNNVFSDTHPDCLATLATLLGMRPAPADQCRVLELGCGTGANLIPMAQDLPGSRFLGIDLSTRQVAMGQQVVRDLGLTNIELRPLSILDVGEDFGRFDYILCHGLSRGVKETLERLSGRPGWRRPRRRRRSSGGVGPGGNAGSSGRPRRGCRSG
jgi:SAM-dependent methyltransferase